MDKRGLSAVITTLLIILLVFISVGVVWVVIKNLFTEGAEDVSLGRFVFDFGIKRAYVDSTEIKVDVRRSPGGGDVTGVRFVFYNGTDSIIIDRDIALGVLDERTFTFISTEVPGIGGGDDVSVAPLYSSGSGENIGDITDTEEIASEPPVNVGGNGNGNGDGNGNGNGNGDDCIPAPDPTLSGICGSFTCGTADNGTCGSVSCGTCSPGSLCDSNICTIDFPPQNTGTIFSVWPSVSKRFFDSPDLPTTDPNWVTENHYVNFSSVESRCILIFDFIVASGSGGDYSYIRLGLDPSDPVPQISVGDGYQVWKTDTCGPV